MVKTRSATKPEHTTNTKSEPMDIVKTEEQPNTTASGLVLAKKVIKAEPQKMSAAEKTTTTIKRKATGITTTAMAKKAKATKVKAEPTTTVKSEPSSTTELTEVKAESSTAVPSTSESLVVKGEPTVKTETSKKPVKAKKEPKPKTPRVKKETVPKAPRVKKVAIPKPTKVPKAPKAPKAKKEPKRTRRPAIKLPPEASIYLDESMRTRVLRAMKQRMFVMSREISSGNDSIEKFEILGSIGNNYTVSIAPRIKCTCMDHALRRTHCKHILMVLLKVYHLPFNSPLFQNLNTSRDSRIEARSHERLVDPSVLVPEEIRQKILGITHKNHPDAAPVVVENTDHRRPLDTSDCPICFEEFEPEKIDEIVFCKTCGNNVHKECFQMWTRSKGSNVTCVYCRSKWKFVNASPTEAGSSKNRVRDLDAAHVNEEWYANFAQELGMSRKRDTSTYKSSGGYRIDYSGPDIT